ncbi:MAG TPA: ABC transporter substrate-binding protein [Acidimicrobiia bacterium]|nr:ABC transporter substrate-binding protein [Acidimicrobiia bacterium]
MPRVKSWTVVFAVLAVLAGACTTSRGKSSSSTTANSAGTATGSQALGQGVTADTIKIGFSYIDLVALAKSGVIRLDHGPEEQIITALVNDVNARGGVNGRKLQLFIAKYSPIGNTDQLAACTKLTEDDKVFAVLVGFLNVNNLCVVQQHQTILVGGNFNKGLLAQARAPWATWNASDERSIDALVKLLDQNGDLKGHTIAVYAAQAPYKAQIDLAVKTLKDAGYKVADTALMDAPDTDLQAATAQDKVIAQRFQSKGVDTVIDVGQFTPGADFDAAGYHPRIFSPVVGNLQAAAYTNPLGKFPIVAGTGVPNQNYNFDDPAFAHCRQVWKQATGNEIVNPDQEDLSGKSSGFVAMEEACTSLTLFVDAAKAAGKDLNNETFAKGVESLGAVDLPAAPKSSFGPNKFDGQDQFQLFRIDPTWKQGSGKDQLIAIGSPITLK